jgi:ABC-type transport system substrate-binding protein
VGVRAKIQTFEWGAYLVKLRSGEADMYEDSWFPRTDDPALILYPNLHYKSAPAPNFNRYSNPEVDRMLDEGRAELDQAKRITIYRRVQEILAQDAPWIPIDHDVQIVATKRNVKGLKLIANYDLRTETVYTG